MAFWTNLYKVTDRVAVHAMYSSPDRLLAIIGHHDSCSCGLRVASTTARCDVVSGLLARGHFNNRQDRATPRWGRRGATMCRAHPGMRLLRIAISIGSRGIPTETGPPAVAQAALGPPVGAVVSAHFLCCGNGVAGVRFWRAEAGLCGGAVAQPPPPIRFQPAYILSHNTPHGGEPAPST